MRTSIQARKREVNDWPDLVPSADQATPREERALRWDHWLEVNHSRVTGFAEVILGGQIAPLLPTCRPSGSYRTVPRIEMASAAASTVCVS